MKLISYERKHNSQVWYYFRLYLIAAMITVHRSVPLISQRPVLCGMEGV